MSELIFGSTGVWFMIGALLVFFMQCGFAMVETGFTRAKNAGNIIMKNLLDFCIGTVVFSVLGFGLMMSEDYVVGFIGIPNLNMFTDWANFDWNSFVFQLVFCATAATIVSGSMAERTKFSAYCVYSAVISLVIYPIEAGWMWNSQGWLAQLGAIDFAGSIVIHMVGGVTALIGAMILGPRIGKYGKDGKVNAIPGHSITLGALGVFILWFAWYGFNGAAAEDGARLGQILLTTTIAPAVATMIFTWVKNGKSDVSMSLNGSLAGLVAVTAGCADVDAIGSAVIGLVSGIIVVLAVEFVDIKLRIDDPVGAFAVHGVNGFWGGLAVGLFATGEGQNGITGLFYGGGLAQLGKQALAILCIIAWTVVCMTIVFFIIKKTIGLRVTKEEEMQGLDISEHGLVSAYADFMPIGVSTASLDETFDVQGNVPVTQAVPVQLAGKYDVATDGVKITKIDIILKQSKLEALKEEMDKLGITGMTVSQVLGCGAQKGKPEYYRGVAVESNLLPKMKVEVVVCKVPVKDVVDAAVKALYTGHIGDGKIFIYNVEDVVKVRTGETGYDAMQDVE